MTWERKMLHCNLKGKVFGVVSRFSTEKSLKSWEGTCVPKKKYRE